ncbi:MAG: NAD(P)/FAD-dependent oxidoreductase [Deltaproteobacteria bacterium]|nr:NAD(P)/FAD-dependent oxidoreductase [Deltaproteobacteria bacterium]
MNKSSKTACQAPFGQKPAGRLEDSFFDAVVCGAGPAGSTAAALLADKGFRVLLLDQAAFPRDKVCGDLLVADAIRSLDRLGLLSAVREKAFRAEKFVATSPGRVEIPVGGEYLTLKRRELDALLAARAVEAGAVFCKGKVETVKPSATGPAKIFVAGRTEPLTARVALAATGARANCLRQAGMLEKPRPTAVATRFYVRSPAGPDYLVAAFDRAVIPGYAWIFPVGDDTYNIGCGVFLDQNGKGKPNLKNMLDAFCADYPLARGIMARATEVSPMGGAPMRCGLSGCGLVADNVVSIGETAGATLPLTGEGIGKSMETAIFAAEAVSRALLTHDLSALESYPARVEEKLRPTYDAHALAQRWASVAPVSDFIARRAQNSQKLKDALAGIMHETTDPRDIFSVRGVLRLLLPRPPRLFRKKS